MFLLTKIIAVGVKDGAEESFGINGEDREGRL